MSSQPVPVISSGVGSTNVLGNIESVILAALAGLKLVPGGIGVTAGLIGVFANILVNAQQAYQQSAGVPYDLSRVPLETPVA
jgi:hypothetical protein